MNRTSRSLVYKHPFIAVLVFGAALAFRFFAPDSSPDAENEGPSAENSPTVAEQSDALLCSHVIDGDTIVVEVNGRDKKVRLLGIDTMEPHNEEKQAKQAKYHGISASDVRTLAKQGSRRMEGLVEGKKVRLIKPTVGDHTDPYGRWLRYVERDGEDIAEVMLKEGLAETRREPHDRKARYAEILAPLAF